MEKQIAGFEDYTINVDGSIYSKHRKRFLKPCKGSHGYFKINLMKDKKSCNKLVHRLVALTFIPNPNNLPDVNHIDGNKENYGISNLEWCTASYNTQHAYRTGLFSDKCNPLYDIKTGERYYSIRQAAKALGINPITLTGYIRGTYPNKTSLRKVI